LVDGVQLSDPSSIANDFDLRLLPLDQVASIEIVKGASSTLYGSGAATAVINITTKTPKDKKISLQLQSTLGTNQSQNNQDYDIAQFDNSVAVSGRLSKFDYQVNFSNRYSENMSSINSEEETVQFEDDPFSKYNVYARLGYKISDQLKFYFYGNYDKFNADYDDSFMYADGNNKTYSTIEKSGIPVIFNGDWTEESPLGKAEWIKFFGALFDKSEEAEEIYDDIAKNYKEAKQLAQSVDGTPLVIAGSMYKDSWFVPYGNSWQAQFIKDANAAYIYKDTEGSGSKALSFESVLNDAQNADFWVAPGQFQSYEQLYETSQHYKQFKAVQNKKVFTYSNTMGATGGVLYYELAPNRPDLVLKDLISIFHPELLKDYKPTFFQTSGLNAKNKEIQRIIIDTIGFTSSYCLYQPQFRICKYIT